MNDTGKKDPININSVDEIVLASKLSISDNLAEAIVEARENGDFTNGVNLANRVQGLDSTTAKKWYAEGLIKYSN